MVTLYDIYKSKGQVLPGMSERFSDAGFAEAAGKAGINAQQYVGSEEQNNAIAGYLKPAPTIATSTQPRQELIKNTDTFSQTMGMLQAPKTKKEDTIESMISKGQGEIDAELKTYIGQLDDIGKRSSLATQNLIRGIGADYSARKAEEADSNSRYMRGLHLLGLQDDTAQATPMLHAGTLRKAEIEGHKELARIDGEERKLIAEAEQAQLDNDFKLFNEKMNAFKEARAAKSKVISDLYDQALNRRQLEKADMELVDSYAAGLYDEYEGLSTSEKAAYVQEIADQLGVSTMAVVSSLSSEKERRVTGSSKGGNKGSSTKNENFTDTQINKGISQSGINMTPEEFNSLSYEEQNMLVNDIESWNDLTNFSDIKNITQYNQAINDAKNSDRSPVLRKAILRKLIEFQQATKLKGK